MNSSFCPNCGNFLEEVTKYCPRCGYEVDTPVVAQAEQDKPRGKRKRSFGTGLVCGILIAAILCGLVFGGWSLLKPEDKIEGNGFDSPEEAVLAYLEGLKNCDANAMVESFAIETFAENFDLHAQLEWKLRAMPNLYNNTTPFGEETTAGKRHGDVALTVQRTILKFCLTDTEYEALTQGSSVAFIAAESRIGYDMIDDFIDLLTDPDVEEAFSEMEIGDFLEAEDLMHDGAQETYNSRPAKEHRRIQETVYGYEEIVPIAIEVEIGGEDYVFLMSVAEFDGKWYNFEVDVGFLGIIPSELKVDIYTGFAIEE